MLMISIMLRKVIDLLNNLLILWCNECFFNEG